MTAFAAARPIRPGQDLSWRLRVLRAVLLGLCLFGMAQEIRTIPNLSQQAMVAYVEQGATFDWEAGNAADPSALPHFWVAEVVYVFQTLALGALAVALLLRAFRRPAARALAALFAVLVGVPQIVDTRGQGLAVGVFLTTALLMLFVRFTTVFPRPLTPDDLVVAGLLRRQTSGRRRMSRNPWRWAGRSLLTTRGQWVWGGVLLGGLDPLVLWAPEGSGLVATLEWVLGVLLTVWWVGGIGWGLNFLSVGLKVADDRDRRGVLWLSLGVGLFMALFLLIIPLDGVVMLLPIGSPYTWSAVAVAYGNVIFISGTVLCVAFAMFHEGALDPGLAIRKTVLYGSLATLLLIVFGAVEMLVTDTVTAKLSLPSTAGTWIAGGAVALLFGPVKKWLGKRTERFLDNHIPVTELADTGRVETAVVFSDIVGYTATTARDEATGLTLAALFHKVGRRVANGYRGRVVKAIGDKVMMEFPRPADALRAAPALHCSFADATDLLELPAHELRTGVHVGPATRSRDGDLLGDSVNLASQLQGAAEPGQILVSEAMAAVAGDETRPLLEPVGERGLKDLPLPVTCFALDTCATPLSQA